MGSGELKADDLQYLLETFEAQPCVTAAPTLGLTAAGYAQYVLSAAQDDFAEILRDLRTLHPLLTPPAAWPGEAQGDWLVGAAAEGGGGGGGLVLSPAAAALSRAVFARFDADCDGLLAAAELDALNVAARLGERGRL